MIVKYYGKGYNGSGDCIVPPNIIKIKVTKSEIFVLSKNSFKERKFWFIDKSIEGVLLKDTTGTDSMAYNPGLWPYERYSNVWGPLDSIPFYRLLAKRGLKFEWPSYTYYRL